MFETNKTINTTKPPTKVKLPGFSPIINHTKIGARIASINSINPTSAEVIYFGPIDNKVVPNDTIIDKMIKK